MSMRSTCRCISLVGLLCLTGNLLGQTYTHADTLRGTNGPARSWWNAIHYDLYVDFDIAGRKISGCNRISLQALEAGNTIQIDLQRPLVIDSIILFRKKNDPGCAIRISSIRRDGDAFFAELGPVMKGESLLLSVFYQGKPREAVNPPWDGGLIWKKDRNSRPFVSVACQSLGASCWYPCKDYQGDEPDSASTHFTVPDSLTAVGNGRFRGKTLLSGNRATYSWAVSSPINNYNIVPYIGDYLHFGERYVGLEGPLDLDYWVLSYNMESAARQFADVPRMLKALEYWFGAYPFYADGYKLVEAPHLGMEHQSAIAYGNYFMKGYLGSDLSGSGWGLKWDYIIVHESGHEWFGNNITTNDIADMWVQEGFTTYSETLFTDYHYGKKAGDEYVSGQRTKIMNDKPVIGPYGVNKEGSSDMYFKGANLLHMIRQIMGNDANFRRMLIKMGRKFRHQTVNSEDIESFMSNESGKALKPLFDQYLRTRSIPVLEYRFRGNVLHYRFSGCNKDFVMPIKILLSKNEAKLVCITPTTEWQELELPAGKSVGYLQLDRNYYLEVKKSD